MGFLTLSSLACADRVFWTQPANNSNAMAGCDVKLGFRVQYSDMAMLNNVQLQVLDAKDQVLLESLDNSTREEWDDVRAKNVTWSVPGNWPSGDYTLRAFGNASYPCTGDDGRRTFCSLMLEDRQILHLQQPMAGQTCSDGTLPRSTSQPFSPPSSTTTTEADSSENLSETDKANGDDDNDTDGLDVDLGFVLPLMDQEPMEIDLDPAVLRLIRENGGINVDHGLLSEEDTKGDTGNDDTPEMQKHLSQQSPKQQSPNVDKVNGGNGLRVAWTHRKSWGTGIAGLMVATLFY
ncbi:MAG: hypothetical protein J3Q66DRAFT_437218 [Benniella sp.]|nr:MAG: hypothetical protein J3Q66DRAFT_437218 [Benniella sp.]